MAGRRNSTAARIAARAIAATKLYEVPPPGGELDKVNDALDDAVAAATVARQGNAREALLDVGVISETMPGRSVRQRMFSVYTRPGVVHRLGMRLRDLQRQKPYIIGRMVMIARFGDEEHAIRAAALLAKIGGWLAPKKLDVDGSVDVQMKGVVVNLHEALRKGGEVPVSALKELAGHLDHDPQEAISVETEAAARAQRNREKRESR